MKISFRFCLFILLLCGSSAYTHENNQLSQEKYLTHRISSSDKRHQSFLLALNLLNERNAKMIVETGTARDGNKNFAGDGGSTIIFGDWVDHHQASFYSVDISRRAVVNAKKAVKSFKHVHVVCDDSIRFLSNFKEPIDLLYLDSFDFDVNNPNPSQEHHLKEIIAAYPRLHANSIVMIDDCGLPYGGKGKLVIDYLLSKGWKIVFQGYQVILVQ